jgi:hypothetical protein
MLATMYGFINGVFEANAAVAVASGEHKRQSTGIGTQDSAEREG